MKGEPSGMENTMEATNSIRVRPARGVRLVEQGGSVQAFPEPHHVPVLPPGWAPLSADQQNAVVAACQSAPDALVMRLGSPWQPENEYRVYRLANDLWGGLSVVIRRGSLGPDPDSGRPSAAQLVGLARNTRTAVRIALDFFNWDLEARGDDWRLEVGATG